VGMSPLYPAASLRSVHRQTSLTVAIHFHCFCGEDGYQAAFEHPELTPTSARQLPLQLHTFDARKSLSCTAHCAKFTQSNRDRRHEACAPFILWPHQAMDHPFPPCQTQNTHACLPQLLSPNIAGSIVCAPYRNQEVMNCT